MQSRIVPIEIPPQYATRLLQLVRDMERDTDRQFQLSVQELGNSVSRELMIAPLDKRSPVQVCDTAKGFEALTGIYASLDAVRARIRRQCVEGLMLEERPEKSSGFAWQCPECHRTGRNYGGNLLCQNEGCHYHHETPWRRVSVGLPWGRVYSSSGGSLSICKELGRIVCPTI